MLHLQSFNNAFTAKPLGRGVSTTLEPAGNQTSYVLHFSGDDEPFSHKTFYATSTASAGGSRRFDQTA